jgi:hypothetical protein
MDVRQWTSVFLEATGLNRQDLRRGGEEAEMCILILWRMGFPMMAMARRKAVGVTHRTALRLQKSAKQKEREQPAFAEQVARITAAMGERALYLERLKTTANRRGGARPGAGRRGKSSDSTWISGA